MVHRNFSGNSTVKTFWMLNILRLITIQVFQEGSNTGAEAAINDGCGFLFISNNDLVFAGDALAELLKILEADPSLACCGPLLMQHKTNSPGLIQEFGGHINFKRGTLDKYYAGRELAKAELPEILETDFIGGGVLFIRSEVFKKAGMYETSYFGYFDEIDLAYRLKVSNNYRMAVTSKAVIWHNHHWVKKNNFKYYFEYYLSQRNKFLYYHKYRLFSSMIYMLLADCIKFPWRLVWFIKVCDFTLGMYYLKGMFDGLMNRKGKPKLSFMK